MSSDELLVRWVHERDEEAFREIVALHAPMVFATSKRILGNELEAEEVTQECFETLATTRRPGGYLGAWLHRVATNRCIDRIRASQRRARRETAFAEASADAAEPTWDDLYELVDGAIAELPKAQREAIIAYFLEGRSQGDIATDLGVTRQTITGRVRLGIEGIRKRLKQRGVQVSAVGLVAQMEHNAAPKAIPESLIASLGKLALTGAAGVVMSAGMWSSGAIKAAAVLALIASIAGGYFLFGGTVRQSRSQLTVPVEAPQTGGAQTFASIAPALESVVMSQLAQTAESSGSDTNLLDHILAEQQKRYDALGKRPYHVIVNAAMYFKIPPDSNAEDHQALRYEEIGDGDGNIWGTYDQNDRLNGRSFALNSHEFVYIPDRSNGNAHMIELVEPVDVLNAVFEGFQLRQHRKSFDGPNAEAKQQFKRYRMKDFLRIGFQGPDGLTLPQLFTLSPSPGCRFDVDPVKAPDGRDLFNIRRLAQSTKPPYSPDVEMIVDPLLGYQVTAVVWRHQDGSVDTYAEYRYREYEPGLFVPVLFRERRWLAEETGPDVNTTTIVASGVGELPDELMFDNRFTIEKLELDGAISPERFSWKSFGWEGREINVTSREGVTNTYLIENGELVPKESE